MNTIEICNLGLIQTGNETINDLTDNEVRAEVCNLAFDPTLREVLSLHPWNAAITRQALALTSTTPAFGYDYAYQLPTDPECLRALWINQSSTRPRGDVYVVERDLVLTDAEEANLIYIGMVDDVTTLPDYLAQLVGFTLAARIAPKLPGGRGVVQMAMAAASKALIAAKNLNAREGHFQVLDSGSSILDARGYTG